MDENKLLKEILYELREIKFWIKLSNIPFIRRAAREYLVDDESKVVYELSNGKRSTRDIANKLEKIGIKITHATVANMWKRWAMVGLVQPSEKYQGRYRKTAPLKFLGVETPKILKMVKKNDEKE